MSTLNVYQRVLAVTEAMDQVKPDKTYNARNRETGVLTTFQYVSIQELMNHLRPACRKHGLVIVPRIDGREIVVEFINADDPSNRYETRWPVNDKDKAFAYTIKYPLMRSLLVGDGVEADEGDAADASSSSVTEQLSEAAAPAAIVTVPDGFKEEWLKELLGLCDALEKAKPNVWGAPAFFEKRIKARLLHHGGATDPVRAYVETKQELLDVAAKNGIEFEA